MFKSRSTPLFVLLSDGAPDEDVVHMADHSIKALQDVGHTCSGAELTPNGSLLKHNLPNGVMTAFEILLRSLSRICQNPEFGSIFENQDTFHSLPSMCSTAGMGYPSQRMDLMSSV